MTLDLIVFLYAMGHGSQFRRISGSLVL